MDELTRALLRWHGRDTELRRLRDLCRFGHVLSPRERAVVERALTTTEEKTR